MEKRRLGKTGHMSSVLALGGAALRNVTQSEADAAIQLAIEHGVSHFDVAPLYGQAEVLLGPWLEKHRKEIFLACKTLSRSKTEARESINRSLERLRVDYFDLYQLHGIDELETLNVVLGSCGALEAILEAKEQGLIRHIGITGHRPYVQIEALNRFDFDTVMFPLSRLHAAHISDFNNFVPLLEVTNKKDVGIIAIKSLARQPYRQATHKYQTWYEPFDKQTEIDKCLWYTLSQEVTTVAMPSDVRLWPMVLDAVERFKPMDRREQEAVVAEMKGYQPIFIPPVSNYFKSLVRYSPDVLTP